MSALVGCVICTDLLFQNVQRLGTSLYRFPTCILSLNTTKFVLWYCLKSLGDWKLVPQILSLSGNAVHRRQGVWIAKIWTKLQRPETPSLLKSTEMPFILQRSWGRVVCLRFSPSTVFFFLLVVGQPHQGHISELGKVVSNSIAASCYGQAWSLLHPRSHAQMTF